ncbi:hypothetical protein GCM10014715_74790 [Streptomyces spiralis]|uniref:Uncharacterized protein n=1 Tax=Streptomyces spiralis TaxID=66376 RepID=A0A919AHF9_9ACTN|nr:hypothetical protein GCM10014715_74790 [Streptomyces spiralis]
MAVDDATGVPPERAARHRPGSEGAAERSEPRGDGLPTAGAVPEVVGVRAEEHGQAGGASRGVPAAAGREVAGAGREDERGQLGRAGGAAGAGHGWLPVAAWRVAALMPPSRKVHQPSSPVGSAG